MTVQILLDKVQVIQNAFAAGSALSPVNWMEKQLKSELPYLQGVMQSETLGNHI